MTQGSEKLITFAGKTAPAVDHEKHSPEGITGRDIIRRIRMGWSVSDAILRPLPKKMGSMNPAKLSRVSYKGEMVTVRAGSEMSGYSTQHVRNFMRRGDVLVDKPVVERLPPENQCKGKYSRPLPHMAVEEYTLRNMQKSMSDEQIKNHLEKCVF